MGITHDTSFFDWIISLFCTFPRSSLMSSEPLQCMLVSKRSAKCPNPRQFAKSSWNPRKQASPRGKRMHFITVWHIPACLSVFNSPWNLPVFLSPHLTRSISSCFQWTHLFYSRTQQVNSINCRTKSCSSPTFDKNLSSSKLVAGERKAKEIRFKWNIPRLGEKKKEMK